MLHGIIDIGSNTIRMAIYEISGESIDMLMKKKHTVGLASYLEHGILRQEGIDRTVEILERFRSFLSSFRIGHVSAFATAALRNAGNSREAVREIERRTGISIRVISGEEEAEYGFVGATHSLAWDSGILADIGGASTEIVFFDGGTIVKKASLPMGSLMFHSKYSEDILPTAGECAKMRAEAESILRDAAELKGVSHPRICGIGGTFKGALALYRAIFSPEEGNAAMEMGNVREMLRRFRRDMEIGTREIALLMKTVPERMHTLLPGLVIADVLAGQFGSDTIIYSDSGVREGYIYSRIIGK